MSAASATVRDYIELTKPRISMLCVLMFVGGYLYSDFLGFGVGQASERTWLHFVFGFAGTWASVASANVLNMVLERRTDGDMTRTASRPLPSGRMKPFHATMFGIVLGLISAALLLLVNFGTFCLGMIALLGYVLVYTPLKRVTPHALIIGAVPGAMPPLMGWTAHHGGVHSVGLILFAILLIWQVPHFMAIAIVHRDDYARAGIRVLPVVAGERRAVLEALVYSVVLLVVSLTLVPLAGAGALYAATAIGLGVWLIRLCWAGRLGMDRAQARRVFVASLVYLPVLTLVLIIEGVARSLSQSLGQ